MPVTQGWPLLWQPDMGGQAALPGETWTQLECAARREQKLRMDKQQQSPGEGPSPPRALLAVAEPFGSAGVAVIPDRIPVTLEAEGIDLPLNIYKAYE